MFHKDEMFKALGYSERVRETGLKFWKLAFDWLVLLDKGEFPLPAGLMHAERSGASIGLNYNPLPDWEKISQPVLLIHGGNDKLSPAHKAITSITNALEKGGNLNYTVKIFPNASHTITTNKTGLQFDWNENFAPNYFQTTTDWILNNADFKTPAQLPVQLVNTDSLAEFEAGGRYSSMPWFGQTYPQILLMILFPLFYLAGLIISGRILLQRKSIKSRKRLFFTFGLLCLINLYLIFGFYAFLFTSIFPQGTMLMQSYSIPWWQKILPLIGICSSLLTLVVLGQIVFNDNAKTKLAFAIIPISVVFGFWLFYWNLIGWWF